MCVHLHIIVVALARGSVWWYWSSADQSPQFTFFIARIFPCSQVCQDFCNRLSQSGTCSSTYTALVGFGRQFSSVSFPDCGLLPPKSNLSLQCYENVTTFSAQILTARSKCAHVHTSIPSHCLHVQPSCMCQLCLLFDCCFALLHR